MQQTPQIYLSSIRFYTDMTRRTGPTIPLAKILEVVWPAKGRWLGLVGRTQITREEMRLVNPPSLPELTKPWAFVLSAFEHSWGQPAGKSCYVLSKQFSYSLNVSYPGSHSLSSLTKLTADAKWPEIVSILMKELEVLGRDLEPTVTDNVVPLPAHIRTVQRSDDEFEQAA
jgi:hypothetical protein